MRSCRLGRNRMQKFELLGLYRNGEQARTSGIAARPVKAGDEAKLHRIARGDEDDGRRCGRGFRSECRGRTARRHDTTSITTKTDLPHSQPDAAVAP